MVFISICLSYSLQRKSNRAKEKKQRRLEERAAMDAVCAKVVAANKVRLFYILKLKVIKPSPSWELLSF